MCCLPAAIGLLILSSRRNLVDELGKLNKFSFNINLTMENLELVKLDKEELNTTNGGFPLIPTIIAGIAVGAAIEIIQDWDNFKRGLSGVPENYKG